MIEVVTRENRRHYQAELRQMFRQRHEVFVMQLKWDLPLAQDGLEQDQFDTDDAIYLLSLDKDRTLLGSKRLLPTTKPHLMSELFPHMVALDIPTGPHIWESSRSCVSPLYRNKGVIGELFLAMVEVGLMSGIEKITFMAGMDFYPTILHAGWGVVPLGFPEPDGENQENIAGYLTIDPVSLHNMRRNYKINHSVLSQLPPTRRIKGSEAES